MSDAIIGVYGTILGVSIGSLFTYLFSKDLARKSAFENSKQVAIAEFRGVFTASINRYKISIKEKKEIPYIVFIIKDEYVKQSLIFEKFRWFIKSKDRKAYQEAWDNYYSGIVFKDYTMSDNSEEEFIKNIYNILEFTNL